MIPIAAAEEKGGGVSAEKYLFLPLIFIWCQKTAPPPFVHTKSMLHGDSDSEDDDHDDDEGDNVDENDDDSEVRRQRGSATTMVIVKMGTVTAMIMTTKTMMIVRTKTTLIMIIRMT